MTAQDEHTGLQVDAVDVDWPAVGRQYETLGYFAKSKGEQLTRIRNARTTIYSAESNLTDIDEQIVAGRERLGKLLQGAQVDA